MNKIPYKSIPKSILKKALLSRFTEEAFLDLFSKGKLHGTVHTCVGQEIAGAVITESLNDGDTIFSNHRCHGHFLSRTLDVNGLVSELMGKESGVCKGVGGSQHLFKDGFYSNGIQGGIVPVAAGLALSHKVSNKNNISVVFIGDGTLGEGVVYETLNLISKWNLPLLVVLEDNKYSQSTEQNETLSGNILDRSLAFGIESFKTNTWDWEDLLNVSRKAIKNIRKDSKPRFLQVETFRLNAHSKGDDNRAVSLIDKFSIKDPLNVYLKNIPTKDKALVNKIHEDVKKAISIAQDSPFFSSNLMIKKREESENPMQWSPFKPSKGRRFVEVLNKALNKIMKEHSEVFLFGEDIESPYGGAFKVTNKLSDEFPGRVRNTPISEACIVGVGAGMGLSGFVPIIEIMFGDFLGLAFDQIINHAAKFNQMYADQVQTNLIIRTPMGGGKGYGPTHSQTLDKHFFGIPGITVIAINNYFDPHEIFKQLIKKKYGPALLIENKSMYGSFYNNNIPEGFTFKKSNAPMPDILISPNSMKIDITFIGYGGISDVLIQACEILFQKHDLLAQTLLISQIYPLKITDYIDHISQSKAIIVVEEGQGFSGFGSEILTQLYESDFNNFKVRRVYAEPICIPSSGLLEGEVLPGIDKIIETALSLEIL